MKPPPSTPDLPLVPWALATALWAEALVGGIAALRLPGLGAKLWFGLYAALLAVAALLAADGRGLTRPAAAVGLAAAGLVHALHAFGLYPVAGPRPIEVVIYLALIGAGALALWRGKVTGGQASSPAVRLLSSGLRGLGLLFVAGWILIAVDQVAALPLSGH